MVEPRRPKSEQALKNTMMDMFPAWGAMVTIDLLMIAATLALATFCFLQRERILAAGAGTGVLLLLSGFVAVVLLYAYDLATMTILPSILGEKAAMQEMMRLHLGYSWYVHVIALLLIVAGLVLCVRAIALQLKEIESARIEAENANRAKSAFLASMSHELRTPLNAIIGFSEIMSSDQLAKKPERVREYAGDINASGRHLYSLVDDLLDLSRIEAGRLTLEFERVDLAKVVDDVLRMLQQQVAYDGVNVSVDLPADLPPLAADRRSMHQVVMNLVTNALKHTPEGGDIVITASDENGDVKVTISDTGEGIAPADLERIFEPYYEGGLVASDNHKSHGLGLAITERLVKAHRGNIRLDSTPGQGTTAEVSLPQHQKIDC
jgi:signal transduction histidine kinase